MATKSKWDSIPDVAEQTELEHGPIKIRWSGHERSRVRRGLVAALEDGYMEKAIAVPVVTRQKTQIVIKTEEELQAFVSELKHKTKSHVCDRIERDIETQRNGDDDESDETELSGEAKRRKEEVDLDTLLNDVVIPHARSKCDEVWPGGTVDVDSISWFWNPQLSHCAGKAYYGNAVPKTYADGNLAIGLAPMYYYKHGVDELLELVRHELIHVWSYEHPDVSNVGHGPKFKQWLGDMDTHRHCKHW